MESVMSEDPEVSHNEDKTIEDPEKNEDEMEKEEEEEDNFEDTLLNLENAPTNVITKTLELVSLKNLFHYISSSSILKLGIRILLFCLYNVYLVTAIAYHVRNDTDFGWCNGLGFIIVITSLLYLGISYFYIAKPFMKSRMKDQFVPWWNTTVSPFLSSTLFQIITSLAAIAALVIFVVIDTKENRRRMVSTLGLFVLVLIGVILSKHPGRIVWRHVLWGLGLQFIFGLAVLRWSTGRGILECFSDKVTTFLEFTREGSGFVYGYLDSGKLDITIPGNPNSTEGDIRMGVSVPTIFAFQALSAVYFLSFTIAVLYHFGVMTWIVAKMGWLLEVSVGTTAAESMNAAANIFLGQSEAPLVIKPFVGKLTKSEIHAVMTGGFASIAGTVLGAYISFGIDAFHLLSASLMSAPAALAFAKVLYPETKVSITNSKQIYNLRPKKLGNALDAGSRGATQGVFLVANIIASLVAVTSCVAMINAIVNWCAVLVGQDEITFQWIIEKVFYPLAWLLGVEEEEVNDVALLLGEKTVINEFVAYYNMQNTLCLSPRSRTIATYALCCFANFSSIGITLGGLTAMCPERAKDMASVVFSAFIGGNVAALLTACVAGTLIDDIGYGEYRSSPEFATCMAKLQMSQSANLFRHIVYQS